MQMGSAPCEMKWATLGRDLRYKEKARDIDQRTLTDFEGQESPCRNRFVPLAAP